MSARPLMLVLALALAAPAFAEPAPPQGVWVTASGNLQVEIAPCGAALCGTTVKVLANNSMAHSGAMAAAPPAMVGLKILTDLKSVKPGTWQGHIFNRENGKTYDCLVEPQGADALKVRAYVASPLFGKDQLWRRAP